MCERENTEDEPIIAQTNVQMFCDIIKLENVHLESNAYRQHITDDIVNTEYL